jgi:uncharacterized protein
MTTPQHTTCVLVFARAPVAGECKTRLIPALGAQGAADLHAKLVRRALRSACEASPARVELWCTPSVDHPFFVACAKEFPITLREQGEGNLGDRMFNAMECALGEHDAAILIGSDIPALDVAYLREAIEALREAPAVFGPAEDGGYVLVGLREARRSLFDGVAWGGPTVMAQTRERLEALHWRATELAPLWDVDLHGDLPRLAQLQDWD